MATAPRGTMATSLLSEAKGNKFSLVSGLEDRGNECLAICSIILLLAAFLQMLSLFGESLHNL